MRLDPLALLATDVVLAAQSIEQRISSTGVLEHVPAWAARRLAADLRRGAHRAIVVAGRLDRHARDQETTR